LQLLEPLRSLQTAATEKPMIWVALLIVLGAIIIGCVLGWLITRNL
jgi:hypothetical protein